VSELPRQIGPFRVVRRLGVGGVGEVLLAVAHGAGGFEKRVALKVLREELRGDAEYERLLLEEARMAARFDHPNLVGVHDVGLSNGVYWVRMDWIDGGDLGALMGSGEERAVVPEGVALAVAHGVSEALAYLHGLKDEAGRSYGLVHRDVSPTNVLIGKNGAVKLADFGLAKATRHREDTRAGVRKGKYAYMSPEQVRGGSAGRGERSVGGGGLAGGDDHRAEALRWGWSIGDDGADTGGRGAWTGGHGGGRGGGGEAVREEGSRGAIWQDGGAERGIGCAAGEAGGERRARGGGVGGGEARGW
jgi:serine/threonine protein kinase